MEQHQKAAPRRCWWLLPSPMLPLLLPPSAAAVAVSNFMQDAIALAGSTPQHDVAGREAAKGKREEEVKGSRRNAL